LDEYTNLFESGKITDVHDFQSLLKRYGHLKAFHQVMKKRAIFDAMLDFLQEESLRNQVYEQPIYTLKRFVQDHKSQKSL